MSVGKADRLVRKLGLEQRLKAAERKANGFVDDRNLTDDDWQFLLHDISQLAGVFLASETGLQHRRTQLKGELGTTLLTHDESKQDGVIILFQTTGAEPPFEAIGVEEGPEWTGDTTELLEQTNKLLSAPGWAFTASWRDSKGLRQMVADYGVSPGHCSEKAKVLAEGGVLEKPIAVSKHPSLGTALVFAHSLNKGTGRLFGGVPYSEMNSLIRGVTK